MHEVRQRSNRILSVLRRFASYFEICFMRFELVKFSSRYGVTPLCDNIFYTRQTGNTCSGSLTLSQALLSMPSVRRPSTLHLDPQDAALAPQQTEGADLMSPVEVIALYIGTSVFVRCYHRSIHLHLSCHVNIKIDCVLPLHFETELSDA
jgi:hypothetical protein